MIKATIKNLASVFLVMLVMGLGTSVSAQNAITSDNLIDDGDFSTDLTNWVVEGAAGTASIIDGELAFTQLVETANQYDFQVNQPLSAEDIAVLAGGGTFQLTFDARTTADSKTFHVFLGEVGGGWARYWQSPGDGDVTVGNTTSQVLLEIDLDAGQVWDNMRLGFEVATDTSSLFVDNIVLRRYEDNLLRDGELVVGDSISTAWNPVGNGALATYSADNGEVKVSGITAGNIFDVQFIQELDTAQVDSIYAGPYEMFFDARTSPTAGSKEIQVFFGNNGTGGDWTNWAPRVTVDDTMKTYSLNVAAEGNWPNMKIGFEISQDTASIWFDNVIVRRVRDIPPAAPTVGISTMDGVVTLDVTAVPDAASYIVYFADSAFTTVEGGSSVGTITVSDGPLTLDHVTYAPHPTLVSSFTAYYGVVAVKENGTTSALTPLSIETSMAVAPNYIPELTPAAVGAIFQAVGSGTMPSGAEMGGFFPDGYVPFTIDENRKVIENGNGGDNDADISGSMWVGFDNSQPGDFLIIYAEITDDILVGAPSSGENPSGAAWNYDSWEVGIGAYSPESFITGSDHPDFERGEEPDYQLRAGIYADDTFFIHGGSGPGGSFDQAVPNSQTLGEETETGYRLLTIVSTLEFSGIETTNVNFDFPTGNNVSTMPFQFALNDNDDQSRDTQISWSSKGGQDDWWNTPARWETVALVGLDAIVTSNEEVETENPFTYSLSQNYPNPFNPSTNIEFTLAANADVTLEVYNMLGQRVATLLEGEKLAAGAHSQVFDASTLASGMYLYKITAGNFVQTRKMMLIK